MPIIDDAQLEQFLVSNPSWTVEGESISRTVRYPDFVGAIGFVNRVALLAERADHHPEIDIRWNKVVVTLSTHSEGGVTSKDTTLAASIDRHI